MGGCFSSDKKTALETNRWSNCNLDEFEKRVNPLIDNIKLSRYKRNILKKRYTKLVIFYENYAENIRWKYNMCRIIISIGSMILPTLQTIQNNETVSAFKDEIFWAAIGTSLSVMISNNLISMFTLDRRYIMYAVTAEKLKAIGWKYFELSDMFSNRSHLENWVLFWNEVEKIKKLQVVAEFTDNDDKHHESLSTIENLREDTESEYDSDTPRSRDTSRSKKTNLHKDEDFYEEDVVINLEEERQKRIQKAQSTFNKNYNIKKFENTINENTINENSINENSINENSINDKSNEIINNINIDIENDINDEKKNVEVVLDNLQETIVENLDNTNEIISDKKDN